MFKNIFFPIQDIHYLLGHKSSQANKKIESHYYASFFNHQELIYH